MFGVVKETDKESNWQFALLPQTYSADFSLVILFRGDADE